MRFGINLLYLYPDAVGGTETYARGLIGGLKKVDVKNKYFLFCSRESAPTFSESSNFKVIKLPIDAGNRVARSIFEIFIFPYYLWKYKINLLHSLGYSSPIFSPCPTIVNIYDLNWHYHPEDFDLFRRAGWKFFVKSSAHFCTKIITSSNSSKKHIKNILKVPGSKVNVVYGGTPKMRKPYSKKYLGKYGINGKYLFTLTADIPHKNILGLLKAYQLILQSGKEYTLVVGGLRGNMKKLAENYIRKNDMDENIIVLGWLKDRDLSTLYKYATVFVIPSMHEGFGFPVLEAFQSGSALVSSSAFSLKEVVGNAGLLFDPCETGEMAKKITAVMEKPKLAKKMIKLGFARVKLFNWEKSARLTLKTYMSVLKN